MSTLRGPRAQLFELVAARYVVLVMAATVLSWKLVQAFVFHKDVAFKSFLEIGLVSIFVPALVWVASREELRLRRDLEKRNQLLEQRARELAERNQHLELRTRETSALNHMMRAHLAICLVEDLPRGAIADEIAVAIGRPSPGAEHVGARPIASRNHSGEEHASNGRLPAAANGHRRPDSRP